MLNKKFQEVADMISTTIKANLKQQEIKELVALSQKYLLET